MVLFHLSLSRMVIFLLTERMIHLRVFDTVQVFKVKGHVDEGMVLDGPVRELD